MCETAGCKLDHTVLVVARVVLSNGSVGAAERACDVHEPTTLAVQVCKMPTTDGLGEGDQRRQE